MPRFLCFCLALLPLLGACQLARMQVSRELADVQPFEVPRAFWRKPNDPLSFGSWRTTRIRVGWGEFRSTPASIGKTTIDLQSFQQRYRLDVVASDGVISADCIQRAEAVGYKDWSLDSGALKGVAPLHCSYSGAAEGEMELLEMPTLVGSQEGNIDFGVTHWHVQSVNRIEGARSPGNIVGYEILRDKEVVAAVQLINDWRVWMSPDLTTLEQDRIASVMMALLVYESPQDKIESISEHERDEEE